MKMGRLTLPLAVLFLSSVAFSCAEDLTARDLPSALPESAAMILLPTESEDPAGSKLPEDVLPTDDSIVKVEYEDPAASKLPEESEFRTVESNEEVTTVTFRPADHRLDGRTAVPVSFRFPFRHRRPCRKPRRPFNPSDLAVHSRQIPYGNDMIMSTKELDSDSKDSQEPIHWARFHHHRHHHHHHGEPELEQKGQKFQMKWLSGIAGGDHDMKKFHRGHPHFEREDDEDEKEHDHHHHHHKHHHHHHDDDDEEEKGGLLIKFRKFLMDRF